MSWWTRRRVARDQTHELETASEDGGEEDVGKGEAVGDEEGLVGKGLLEEVKGLDNGGLGGIDVGLVVRLLADEGGEPSSDSGEDGHVGVCKKMKDRQPHTNATATRVTMCTHTRATAGSKQHPPWWLRGGQPCCCRRRLKTKENS